MATNRTADLPGVFGSDANTLIPAYPIQGQGYRNASMANGDIQNGGLYQTNIDSTIINQLLFLMTTMLSQLAQQGFMGWCPTTPYTSPSFCVGNDGATYFCLSANLNVNPVGDVSGKWEMFITAGGIIVQVQALSAIKRGSVNSDGSINQGTGLFTVAKTGTGLYTVTFVTSFSVTPVVMLSSGNPTQAGNSTGECYLISSNTSGFSMGYLTHGTSDIAVDSSFSFLAI